MAGWAVGKRKLLGDVSPLNRLLEVFYADQGGGSFGMVLQWRELGR